MEIYRLRTCSRLSNYSNLALNCDCINSIIYDYTGFLIASCHHSSVYHTLQESKFMPKTHALCSGGRLSRSLANQLPLSLLCIANGAFGMYLILAKVDGGMLS